MLINDAYSSGSDIETLDCDLNVLLRNHGQFLSQNNLLGDVRVLKWATERSIAGSAAATFYLRRNGERIVTLLKEKMAIAKNRMNSGNSTISQFN